MTAAEQYTELSFYTLSLGDAEFIHQHVVDAFAAQTADEQSKSIFLFFALAGLYLHVEKGYTGRQVQRAHMRMAKKDKNYPRFTPPVDRGAITAADALAASPGPPRNEMIHRWCVSVWSAFEAQREAVIGLTESLLT